MTTISVPVDEREYAALRVLASARDADPVDLLREYVAFLTRGGLPLSADSPTSSEIAQALGLSSAWAWLLDEPDDYTLEDGEPY